jgi:hypothetical protein
MRSSRTIITISDEEKRWLVTFSRTQRISLAEGVRRGISCLKASEGLNIYRKIIQETQGIWKKGEGLTYQEKLRSEWDSR